MEALLAEIDRRFVQIERMLAGSEAEALPRKVELRLAQRELQEFSHFEKAAVSLLLRQLRKLEEVSRALLECVREIEGSGLVTSASCSGSGSILRATRPSGTTPPCG
jgi:hypothetical protein